MRRSRTVTVAFALTAIVVRYQIGRVLHIRSQRTSQHCQTRRSRIISVALPDIWCRPHCHDDIHLQWQGSRERQGVKHVLHVSYPAGAGQCENGSRVCTVCESTCAWRQCCHAPYFNTMPCYTRHTSEYVHRCMTASSVWRDACVRSSASLQLGWVTDSV